MTNANANTTCREADNPEGRTDWQCCGPDMSEMMQACPCGSVLKGRRGILYAILAAVALVFLISQVGGILGTIGFFRTF